MAAFLNDEFEAEVTRFSVSRALKGAGWSRKSTQNVAKERDTVAKTAVYGEQTMHPSFNMTPWFISLAITNQTSELDAQTVKKVLHKEVINEALVSLIAVHRLLLRLVESDEFHTFCKALNPQATTEIMSSHAEVGKKVASSWLLQKDAVLKRLQSAPSNIHISADIWTSPNQELFLGICAQFVDYETEKLSKALLALPVIFSHSAEAQLEALSSALRDYGIDHKLGAFIGDNASSNDKLCRLISSALQKESISWDATVNRIRCSGHVINLAVKAFLFQEIEHEERQIKDPEHEISPARKDSFRSLGPLGQLHNIVVHIRGSSARLREFIKLAGRAVPLDNYTRWNSWHAMLQVATEKSSEIDSYSKQYLDDLESDYLSPQDWERLRTILEFLKPFHRATKATEGDAATIDRVLFMMDILVQHFKTSLEKYESDVFFGPRILRSRLAFDKYYLKTEDSPYYAAAMILHPSRRIGYLKHSWDKRWVRPAVQAVKQLWCDFKAQDHTSLPVSRDNAVCSPAGSLEAFDLIAERLRNFPRPQSRDEYEEYTSEPAILIDVPALQWWLDAQQRKRWPKLSQLAVNILSIPAMSAEAERVFSGARRTISWERMKLGEDTVEKVECLKHWRKNGLTRNGP
ncbi:hypothetical protein O9K51_10794 [Purpureocillium lavendulum]|uniref:HAT C-terminal dimerisation domain-containing protein n=1 Tax=Purpureocillium lavendulum TaxID=1247861 RepID=A0AB34FBU5_9HYPO|nr:hypothetical protein O9K51_10794 [Purpureocillium lavendulum]